MKCVSFWKIFERFQKMETDGNKSKTRLLQQRCRAMLDDTRVQVAECRSNNIIIIYLRYAGSILYEELEVWLAKEARFGFSTRKGRPVLD